MNKLEVGMKFPNLRKAYEFLGIEDEFFGQQKNKRLKFSEFCKWHRINKHSIVVDEVFDERKQLYVPQKRYTLDDLRDNFIDLYNKFGRVLTYNEFVENTNISLATYCSKLNLSGEVYDVLIEKYISKEARIEYRKSMNEYRKMLGETQGKENFIKYTLEDLENNFKQIFDEYMEEYGVYPTRHVFNSISTIDESIYRKRLNLKWSETCEKYGYEIDERYKSERLALEICKKIFNVDYVPQKTFDWLINDRNHHLFCDGYFEDISLVIEFDGAAHRIPVKIYGGKDTTDRQKYNDSIKDKLLKEHGINVIRIDSRLEWYTEEVMLKIIESELSKNNIDFDLIKAS